MGGCNKRTFHFLDTSTQPLESDTGVLSQNKIRLTKQVSQPER